MSLRTLPWMPLVLAGIVGVLLATLLWQLDVVGPFGIVGQFSLAGEQTLAVWWSTLLFTVAALACFQQAREGQGARWAWALLAAVLLILSWDEAGSLHERAFQGEEAGDLTRNIVGALLGASTFAAVMRLLPVRATRASGVFFFLAFGLLATVPVQEWLEHNSDMAARLGPARVLIEEGTELAAAFLLLAGCARARTSWMKVEALAPSVATYAALRPLLLLLLAPVAAACLLWLPHLTDLTFRGNPGLWFASVVPMAIGLTLVSAGRELAGLAVLAASAAVFALTPPAVAFNGLACLLLCLAAYGLHESARALLLGRREKNVAGRGGNLTLDPS